eukprot:gene4489-6143_t
MPWLEPVTLSGPHARLEPLHHAPHGPPLPPGEEGPCRRPQPETQNRPMTSRPRRSALYMPASNAKAIEKARSLPCDVVILDLEDAVAPEAKEAAREQAVQAVRDGGFGNRELVIRVNGSDTPWGADDLRAAACGTTTSRPPGW